MYNIDGDINQVDSKEKAPNSEQNTDVFYTVIVGDYNMADSDRRLIVTKCTSFPKCFAISQNT